MSVFAEFFICSSFSLLKFILLILAGPCQQGGLLCSGVAIAALMATCLVLWLCCSLNLLLLLVWTLSAFTSGLSIFLDHVMPLVYPFASACPALASGVAAAAFYATMYCMAVFGSHFWFGHCY